jgi:hypothetical protein
MDRGAFEKPALSGRHIIQSGDAMARGKKAVHHVTADKACRPGN